jgi:hypothetical protein
LRFGRVLAAIAAEPGVPVEAVFLEALRTWARGSPG